MPRFKNADVHIYLDRDGCWRARIDVIVNGKPLRMRVPDGPASQLAMGTVPICLAIAAALDGHGGVVDERGQ